ncbi:MAG: molybdopterin-guanine dinucleotide biosynthesis protein A [Candidatus Endobugula sp.]|jgi:molybdopterin-guanine dinucleotide biosynthesis protein A
MRIHSNDILGLILAGGQNRRMGDQLTKWQLPLDGKPLLEHIVESLRPQVTEIILNGSNSALKHYPYTVIEDIGVKDQGPLAGLLAGLLYAREHDYSWLVSCPCDSPFIPHNYVTALSQSIVNEQQHCSIASSKGRRHPVFGLWSVKLIKPLRHTLSHSNLRSIGVWANQLQPPAAIVDFSLDIIDGEATANSNAFFNINTIVEWYEAQARYAKRS